MVRIDPSLCIGCNVCIRACPVIDANNSHNVNGRDVIDINEKTASAAVPV